MKNRVTKLKNSIDYKINESYFKFNSKIDENVEHNKENIPIDEDTEDDDLIVDYQNNMDDSDNEEIEDLKDDNSTIKAST